MPRACSQSGTMPWALNDRLTVFCWAEVAPSALAAAITAPRASVNPSMGVMYSVTALYTILSARAPPRSSRMSHSAPEKIVEFRCTPPLSVANDTPRKLFEVVAPSLRSRRAQSAAAFVRHRFSPIRPAVGSLIGVPLAVTSIALPK